MEETDGTETVKVNGGDAGTMKGKGQYGYGVWQAEEESRQATDELS